MKVIRLIIVLLACLIALGSQASQMEDLEVKVDSLWEARSYTRLLPVLEELQELSVETDDKRRQVESLIKLHEYMAYCIIDNDKAVEYITNAVDYADHYGLDSLRLKVRTRLLYFHQSTTRDEKLVTEVLGEMKAINQSLKSKFYTFAINQWAAQIAGNKRIINYPVSEDEIKRAIISIRESINYFTDTDQEHLFYYQQVRRVIVGFFSESFDYDKCQLYLEELYSIAPRMRDPTSAIGNLIYEGHFWLKNKNRKHPSNYILYYI